MRKLTLGILFLYIGLLKTMAQTAPDTTYKPRYLKVEEANLVSSYYRQDGNNSAVTGGIGTEKLTDFANTFDLKLTKLDKKDRLHTVVLEAGVDAYTSASSDKIDPNTISSASYQDVRFYPSVAWSVANPKKRTTKGLVLSASTEYDYQSVGLGWNFTKASKNENREFGIKFSSFFDTWEVILPKELRPPRTGGGGDDDDDNETFAPRNSYNLQLSLAQVMTKRLQMALILEPSFQSGLLATKYQRVYFTDGSVQAENLPTDRWKLPIGVRANYFLGNRVILRGFYRYYTDQWQLSAHTAMLEMPIKISPFFTFSPFYRAYKQQGVPYFAPYRQHLVTDTYYTSDYDLSSLSSRAYGAGMRFTPQNGVFGLSSWYSFELRYEHYERSTGLRSDIVTVGLKFKPEFEVGKEVKQWLRERLQ